MDITRLEQLLKHEENENLEFKQEIHLDTTQGKARFVKELLALANSTPKDSEAYLIIGVEDKTKNLLGMETELPEEQIQQLVAAWCYPPLSFRVETVTYQGKRLGVITIYSERAPYTAKKTITDRREKILLRAKEVYIRRGSTIDTATPDETVDIAQARLTGLEGIEGRLSRLNNLLEDWIAELRWENAYAPLPSSPDRTVETALIGALSMGTTL